MSRADMAVGKIGKTRWLEAAIASISAPILRILAATSRNATKYYTQRGK
jgi:hypothetical protein